MNNRGAIGAGRHVQDPEQDMASTWSKRTQNEEVMPVADAQTVAADHAEEQDTQRNLEGAEKIVMDELESIMMGTDRLLAPKMAQ